MRDEILPIVPGRGLVTKNSTQMRHDFMLENDLPFKGLSASSLDVTELQNNIESYIGSTEVPLGIVGPLAFNNGDGHELVYTAVGTLEGALVASMNRGAKALSLSGGFSATMHWQRMTRSPLFLFEKKEDALEFSQYVKSAFDSIKNITKQYSNHADLLFIDTVLSENDVHLKFVYSTGDASGQNMTTSCTWHAMLFIVEEFKNLTGIVPLDFVIEGNGASDKKISQYNISTGRGVNVTAECFLPEEIINRILRTTSEKMENCFHPSLKLAKEEGMVGYNINLANAIAAIFVATGQDLACIHESAVGTLELNRNDKGLNLKLTLPNLVIGTIGGGTHLTKQAEALKLMGCLGSGKIERFAKLIAGYALGLEISTYAAIVSGEFAKAHEKLGRNKPVKWLLRSDLTEDFIVKSLDAEYDPASISKVTFTDEGRLENGILTNIAGKISKKLIGFVNLELDQIESKISTVTKKLLLKSKPLDREIVKGIHVMAASIDTGLADLIKDNESALEYKNAHLKELEINEYLHQQNFKFIPQYFGKKINRKREIFFFMQEFLDYSELSIINSENNPELWNETQINHVLEVMSSFHNDKNIDEIKSIQSFTAWEAIPLYRKLIDLVINERADEQNIKALQKIIDGMSNWRKEADDITISKTVIHNDCNPRNIAIRKNGEACIYDWELAVVDFPSRDIVEFLSFVLPIDFKADELNLYLDKYTSLNQKWSKQEWKKAFIYSLKTYIASRVSFYEVSGILVKYEFSNRILTVALRMLEILENE